MRPRPIRPNIYLPVARFGVLISDWKFVFVATLAAYSTPFLLDLKLWGAPLELWSGLGAAALSIAFFNYARIGRRPFWLHIDCARCLQARSAGVRSPQMARDVQSGMDYCGVKEK